MTRIAFAAPRRWLAEEASRLDASCYATGGIQARERITRSDRPWTLLGDVAEVFLPPRFARRFVRNGDRGVPFLSSSDILLADLVGLPTLSSRATSNLSDLTVKAGWSLVTRSGTIGRVAYVRGEMAGMAVSEDAIRLAPTDKSASGFLFAFLSSAPAQAMIHQRTYGSVIQHIEPHHLADLPVPTPEEGLRGRIQTLVESAASSRADAASALDEAAAHFDRLGGPMPSTHDHARAVGLISRSSLKGRLDAFHHVGWAAEPRESDGDRLADISDVIATARVPRVYTKGGVPFLSGIDVFKASVTPRVRLAAWVANDYDARVRGGDMAVQGSGQRYGLLGRVAYIGERLDGWAASHDLFRIRTADPDARARIFAFLRSDSGHRVMLRHSYGTSIPHVNPAGVAAIRVPELPADLTSAVRRALELREEADRDEQRAVEAVDAWLA